MGVDSPGLVAGEESPEEELKMAAGAIWKQNPQQRMFAAGCRCKYSYTTSLCQ